MLLIPKYETANFKSRDKRVMKSRPQGVDSLDAYVVEALGGARSLVSEKEFMPFLGSSDISSDATVMQGIES